MAEIQEASIVDLVGKIAACASIALDIMGLWITARQYSGQVDSGVLDSSAMISDRYSFPKSQTCVGNVIP